MSDNLTINISKGAEVCSIKTRNVAHLLFLFWTIIEISRILLDTRAHWTSSFRSKLINIFKSISLGKGRSSKLNMQWTLMCPFLLQFSQIIFGHWIPSCPTLDSKSWQFVQTFSESRFSILFIWLLSEGNVKNEWNF